MRSMLLLGVVPVLALAGCNDGPTVKAENASVADVAAQVAKSGVDDNFISPGQWRSEAKVVSLDMPGMPPQVREQMKSAMMKTTVTDQCVTPEQAKHPNAGMFAGKAGSDCRYDKFAMGSGKLDAVMQCKGEGGAAMHMTLAGSYAPDTYRMNATMTMDQPGAAGGQTMKIVVASTATRQGPCKS